MTPRWGALALVYEWRKLLGSPYAGGQFEQLVALGVQRNHHAHVPTSTRRLEAEGFTAKTRVFDPAKTGGVEIEQTPGVWADLQNRALERAGEVVRVLFVGDTPRADPRCQRAAGMTAVQVNELVAAMRQG